MEKMDTSDKVYLILVSAMIDINPLYRPSLPEIIGSDWVSLDITTNPKIIA